MDENLLTEMPEPAGEMSRLSELEIFAA